MNAPAILPFPQSRLGDSYARPEVSERTSERTSSSSADGQQGRHPSSPSVVYIRSESHEQYASYEHLSRSGHGVVQNSAATQPLEQVAGPSDAAREASSNILSFIEAQLRLDVSDGATQEELASRLEAGLEGFLQGFDEARDQLDSMGFLTDDMDAEIQGTYDLVVQGVAELEEEYLGGLSIDKPVVERPQVVESAPVTSGVQTVDVAPTGFASAYSREEYGQSNRFSFELTTADGDVVTIKASTTEAMLAESLTLEGQGSVYSEGRYGYQQSSRFSLEVEGSLNKQEMAAIADLLSQVNDLSESFFAGDMTGAFEQALSLGYDTSEITAFSLNLSQTAVQRVTQAYQAFAPENETVQADLAQRLQPVGGFVQGLLEAVETASAFEEPKALVERIAEWFEQGDDPPRFQPLVSRLLDGLDV